MPNHGYVLKKAEHCIQGLHLPLLSSSHLCRWSSALLSTCEGQRLQNRNL